MKPIPGIDDGDALDRALDLLRSGGVVVLPTDTIYGLHAAVSRRAAVERISRLKGGEPSRRFLLLAASLEMVERYVASFGCSSREQLSAVWPAPVTAVLPAGGACPPWVGETVAVRVPGLQPLRVLIDRLGEPVVSTSANRSGEPPLDDVVDIARRFDVDLVIAGGGSGVGASTIVDLCGASAVVLRRGDYDWPEAATGDSNPSK